MRCQVPTCKADGAPTLHPDGAVSWMAADGSWRRTLPGGIPPRVLVHMMPCALRTSLLESYKEARA